MADPVIVQHKRGAFQTTGHTATVTLDAAPTVGNLMVAFFHWNGSNTDAYTLPTGWTNELKSTIPGGAGPVFIIASRIVQAGDTAGPYNFVDAKSTNSVSNVTIVEISHQAAGTAWKYSAATSIWTPGLTDTIYGTATTTPTRPVLVLAQFLTAFGVGAATYELRDVSGSVSWTQLYGYLGAGSLNGANQLFTASLYAPTVLPHGKPVTHVSRWGSNSNASGVANMLFVAIAGEDAVENGAYVDTVTAEVVGEATDVTARVDQVFVEVVSGIDDAAARVDTVIGEVVYGGPSEARVDLAAVEIVGVLLDFPVALQVDAVTLEAVVPHPSSANTIGAHVGTMFLEAVTPYPVLANSSGLNVDTLYLEAVTGGILPPPTPSVAVSTLIPLIS